MTPQNYQLSPTENEKKLRLDKFISLHLPDISRSRVKQLIAENQVKKSDQVINDCSYRVKPGDLFDITIPEAEDSDMKPNFDIKLDIIYENDDFIVINKQEGLTVHPGAGNPHDTMANALIASHGDKLSGIGGVTRPGIVHRLDKDTSGLILVAKNDHAHHSLSTQIAERTAKRRYLAICWGVPKPHIGTIESEIGRNPKHRLKMAVVSSGGKNAITHYEVKEIFAGGIASLVECRLQTGRTHQIRVHLTQMGHPLIGDPLYGNNNKTKMKSLDEKLREFLTTFERQALHSYYIGVQDPTTNEHIEFNCPLPDDMKNLLELLRQQNGIVY